MIGLDNSGLFLLSGLLFFQLNFFSPAVYYEEEGRYQEDKYQFRHISVRIKLLVLMVLSIKLYIAQANVIKTKALCQVSFT